MTKRNEDDENLNWWSELKITVDEELGHISFKLGKMEYMMTYDSFKKMSKQIKEEHDRWKIKKQKEVGNS